MKKLIAILFVLMIGGVMIMMNSGKEFDSNSLTELVTDVEFDTTFNQEDFDYNNNISRKYSDDVGLSEWIGL